MNKHGEWRYRFTHLNLSTTLKWVPASCLSQFTTGKIPQCKRCFNSPNVYTDSGVHPASHAKVIEGSFPGGKAAGMWRWPLISTSCQGQEWMELHLQSPYMAHLEEQLLPHLIIFYYLGIFLDGLDWTRIFCLGAWLFHMQVNLSGKVISFVSSSHPLLLFIYPLICLSHAVSPYPSHQFYLSALHFLYFKLKLST